MAAGDRKGGGDAPGSGYLSGTDLSRSLHVSRTAVWKHIRSLQKKGYKIKGTPSKGYFLQEVPDVLSVSEIRKGLGTVWIGKELFLYPEIGSTNDQAMEMGEKGVPAGAVFLAEAQSRGKGRMGRTWISPPGVNLYISVLFRPQFSPQQAPMMTLMAAVAAAEAIVEATGLPIRIKWPNDILIDGKKAAGILTEMNAEQDRIHYLVVGLGINVNMQRDDLPLDFRDKGTSLKEEAGHRVDRVSLLCRFLKALEVNYEILEREGSAAIVRRWESASGLKGKRIAVNTPTDRILGTMDGLSTEGALIVRLPDGHSREVFAGDVELLEEGNVISG
jgi:BirA family biotin operon repressor/biotin-[acetyl-CoA-carboxylase] ligase